MLLIQGLPFLGFYYLSVGSKYNNLPLGAENDLDFTQTHLTSEVNFLRPGIVYHLKGDKAWVFHFVFPKSAASWDLVRKTSGLHSCCWAQSVVNDVGQ